MCTLDYKILPKNKGIVITGRGTCEDKNIVIPEEIDGIKVVAIDNRAFRTDDKLFSIQIANTIEHIGETAFYDCKNLKYVLIPAEVHIVGRLAFACCKKLEHIIFGRIGQMDWFAEEVFYCSNNIKNIEIIERKKI